jgi:hypothetical protein
MAGGGEGDSELWLQAMRAGQEKVPRRVMPGASASSAFGRMPVYGQRVS